MPTLDIDGRGNTVEEAVQDLWKRVQPLQERGYHPITSVEVVDVKTKKVIESYEVTDAEFVAHLASDEPKKSLPQGKKVLTADHKPPKPHEFSVIARLRLES